MLIFSPFHPDSGPHLDSTNVFLLNTQKIDHSELCYLDFDVEFNISN